MEAAPDHQDELDLQVPPSRQRQSRVQVLESEGQRAVFFGPIALQVYDIGDRAAEAAGLALLARAGVAPRTELAEAFSCHRNTVMRLERRMERGGMAAVVPAKRGPKGPHKVTPAVLAVVAANADQGRYQITRLIAEQTGVRLHPNHVSRLLRKVRQGVPGPELWTGDAEPAPASPNVVPELQSAAPEAVELAATPDPLLEAAPVVIGTVDEQEAAPAWDPPAVIPEVARGRYMGTALYYPALEVMGLVEAARKCFRLPNSKLFGVRAVMLTLFFLTLLSQTTVEAAKHLRRFEFGPVIGVGRAPAVKTLRRKLAELVQQNGATLFEELLVKRWVEQAVVATSYLYVDGHMKAYHGKRKLAECWNSQRRMPLPGMLAHFVNDLHGRPLLFVTEEANVTLAKAMPRVVKAIRQVLGDRHFTVIFDRGGFDGDLFTWLHKEKIDFITYQKGNPGLPQARFTRRQIKFEGKTLRFWIAEDQVSVAGSGPWRRIVVRTKNGHQTPILTSLTELPAAQVAVLMFARWGQENFFKYMGEHMGLNQLLGYAYQDADGSQLVPNPERQRMQREFKAKRQQLAKLYAKLGQAALVGAPDSPRPTRGVKIAQQRQVQQVGALEAEIAELKAQRSALPSHMPLQMAGPREVMRLDQKAIIDRVKMTAYNAEEWLLERLAIHYHNPDDIRQLLRSFAELSGEIRNTAQGIVVTLDPPDTPIYRRALRGLCVELSQLGVTFPGTDLPVRYEVAVHQSELAA